MTSSSDNNAKLLQQLKSSFKRTINWNKHRSKMSKEGKNHFLDFLIDPSFQGVNKLSILSFSDNADRPTHIFSSNCRNKRLKCYD